MTSRSLLTKAEKEDTQLPTKWFALARMAKSKWGLSTSNFMALMSNFLKDLLILEIMWSWSEATNTDLALYLVITLLSWLIMISSGGIHNSMEARPFSFRYPKHCAEAKRVEALDTCSHARCQSTPLRKWIPINGPGGSWSLTNSSACSSMLSFHFKYLCKMISCWRESRGLWQRGQPNKVNAKPMMLMTKWRSGDLWKSIILDTYFFFDLDLILQE